MAHRHKKTNKKTLYEPHFQPQYTVLTSRVSPSICAGGRHPEVKVILFRVDPFCRTHPTMGGAPVLFFLLLHLAVLPGCSGSDEGSAVGPGSESQSDESSDKTATGDGDTSEKGTDSGDDSQSDTATTPESDIGTDSPSDGDSDGDTDGDTDGDSDGDGDADTDSDTDGDGDSDGDGDADADAPSAGNCGDGILTADEACDDKNNEGGDGCAASCLFVEPGYSCNPPGEPCQKVARCGDGTAAFPELCDDGNTLSGDGCSDSCKVELGFKCEGSPSVCTPTTCGDGVREGAEGCDDGNDMPFDGCDVHCQNEPDCAGESCVSDCGDGLVINEACDDGNTLDGDGCSGECAIEEGYTCAPDTTCEEVAGECVLRISAVFRDFDTYGDPAGDFAGGGDIILKLVAPTLDEQGKPVAVSDVSALSGNSIASPESFARWYRESEDSETLVGSLVLFDNGAGGYVNRFGAEGEPWCVDSVCYDGTPAFFPVDALTGSGDFIEATIPEEYGGNWLPESTFVPDALPHNFGYTTEVKYWFRYDETSIATLDFLGDDDMWVFVNGRLALDLGNLHMPLEGTVTVNQDSAASFGLTHGNVYPIQVFHAERNPTGSSFKLTLEGFDASRSLCLPDCGDGIVGLGEECDDGENDGGYGECYPGCVLGDYCGDGVVQENEDCDDGNTLDGDECGSSCRHIIVV